MKMKQTRHIELPANYKVQHRRRDYSTSITWQRYRYCSRSRYQLTFKSPHKKLETIFRYLINICYISVLFERMQQELLIVVWDGILESFEINRFHNG